MKHPVNDSGASEVGIHLDDSVRTAPFRGYRVSIDGDGAGGWLCKVAEIPELVIHTSGSFLEAAAAFEQGLAEVVDSLVRNGKDVPVPFWARASTEYTETVSFKVTVDQLNEIDRAVKIRGGKRSAFCREASLREAKAAKYEPDVAAAVEAAKKIMADRPSRTSSEELSHSEDLTGHA